MTDLKENEMKNLLLETFYFRTTVKKKSYTSTIQEKENMI